MRGSHIVSIRAGCLEGLNKHMLDQAIHIWCQEAIVVIPEGLSDGNVDQRVVFKSDSL
jgi:hypothetical protein